MATYDSNKLTNLEALKALADRVAQTCATKEALATAEGKITALEQKGGEPNKIESIKVNGTAQSIGEDKSVDISVPTNNNQLTNGAGYQTASDVKTAVDNAFKTFEEAVTDDEVVNTYKELIEWAAEHGSDAAEIVGRIDDLEEELDDKVDKVSGKQLSTNDFDDAAKAKLAGIQDGANNYTHPDSAIGAKASDLYKVATDKFGHVIGATKVEKGDITALGIPGSDTTYNPATGETPGLMSANDKKKLDAIEPEANKYVHPDSDAGALTSKLYKVATDKYGHVIAGSEVQKGDITALGIPGKDTTYENATTTVAGLMSATDKEKLDGMEIATTAEITAMLNEVFGA